MWDSGDHIQKPSAVPSDPAAKTGARKRYRLALASLTKDCLRRQSSFEPMAYGNCVDGFVDPHEGIDSLHRSHLSKRKPKMFYPFSADFVDVHTGQLHSINKFLLSWRVVPQRPAMVESPRTWSRGVHGRLEDSSMRTDSAPKPNVVAQVFDCTM